MTERKPYEPAYLPSAGFEYKRATLHTFDRHEPLNHSDLMFEEGHGPRGMSRPVAVIYRCTETGVERRWGVM